MVLLKLERNHPRAGRLLTAAAQRRKMIESREKTHTLCVKLAWMSATWQGGGFRKRLSKSKVPEKAYLGSSPHPTETEKKKSPSELGLRWVGPAETHGCLVVGTSLACWNFGKGKYNISLKECLFHLSL